jgi:hypothetical protein
MLELTGPPNCQPAVGDTAGAVAVVTGTRISAEGPRIVDFGCAAADANMATEVLSICSYTSHQAFKASIWPGLGKLLVLRVSLRTCGPDYGSTGCEQHHVHFGDIA